MLTCVLVGVFLTGTQVAHAAPVEQGKAVSGAEFSTEYNGVTYDIVLKTGEELMELLDNGEDTLTSGSNNILEAQPWWGSQEIAANIINNLFRSETNFNYLVDVSPVIIYDKTVDGNTVSLDGIYVLYNSDTNLYVSSILGQDAGACNDYSDICISVDGNGAHSEFWVGNEPGSSEDYLNFGFENGDVIYILATSTIPTGISVVPLPPAAPLLVGAIVMLRLSRRSRRAN